MHPNGEGNIHMSKESVGSVKTILLVCTGNLCRSPMAVGLLRDKLAREGLEDEIRVLSAGTWAVEGAPASLYAVQVMARRGIDIRAHRARPLTEELVDQADLILVMERNHAEAIAQAFPAYASKVHLLSEMSGQSFDVPDPYGGPLWEYEQCADLLTELIEQGYPRIIRQVLKG